MENSGVVVAVVMMIGMIMSAAIFIGGICIGYRMGIKTVRQDQTPLFDGAFQRPGPDITDTE